MTLPRVIAKSGGAFLVETRAEEGRRYGSAVGSAKRCPTSRSALSLTPSSSSTRRGNVAIAYLRERLGVPESEAREILFVAEAPDPAALAGRV